MSGSKPITIESVMKVYEAKINELADALEALLDAPTHPETTAGVEHAEWARERARKVLAKVRL